MINAAHAIIYSEDAEASRAFFRDVLGLPYVDAHDGWLIFRLPPSELGIHPTMTEDESSDRSRHELFLMCDDIDETIGELEAKGVEFTSGIQDRGFGRFTTLRVPGGGELGLYQPSHPTAFDLASPTEP